MRAMGSVLIVIAALMVAGCGKKEVVMEPLGGAAPMFGAQDGDLQKFIVGRWCLVSDNGVNTSRFYEFAADGTFKCGGHEDGWTGTGRYAISGDSANLTYETIKGKPLEEFRASYKKDEERGDQASIARALIYDNLFTELSRLATLWVDEDKSHLTFLDPKSKPELGGDFGSVLNAMGKEQLERMGPKKD